MSKTDFDYERCIVSIWINGKVNGTGFVIGPGKVLTCAHVVLETDEELGCEKSLKKTIEIEFFGVPRSQNSDDPPALQPVAIDPDHFSPEAEQDIAIRTWDGDLPEQVTAARFSVEEKLAGRHVRTRGFPVIPPYCSQPGIGTIQGTTTHVTGALHWTLTSQEITGGFSGAPIFDPISGHVVAMVRAVIRPDTHWRNKETAIGIQVQTILDVCKDLIQLPEEPSTFDFATNYLKENLDAQKLFSQLIEPKSQTPLSADMIVQKVLKVENPLLVIREYLGEDVDRPDGLLSKRLTDVQCDTIWQICDFATCLVLPVVHVARINSQLDERKIDVHTHDRQLIVIHLAHAFKIPKFDGSSVADTTRSIFERRRHGIIGTDDEAIRLMGNSGTEAGAGGNRRLTPSPGENPSESADYQQQFIRGLAYQLHLPRAKTESLEVLLEQIHIRFAELKAKGKDKAPVVAVLMTESRDNDIKILMDVFKDLYFIPVPAQSDRDYAAIILYRDDIAQIIDQYRRKQNV